MTNLEWLRTLSAEELSDLLYDYWLPRGQYVWTDSRKGLIKVLGEDYLERDCNKCKHQGNCYCVKGFGCPFELKDEPQIMYYSQVDGITPNVIDSKDKSQLKVKRGCIYCKEKEGCINAFTEVSQYCGNYEQIEMNE